MFSTLALKVLVGYHDATGDDRIPACIARGLRMLDRHIDRNPLSDWRQFRRFEFLVSIYWLYEQSGESWLPDLAVKLHAQGFNWLDFFRRWPLTSPTERGRWNYALEPDAGSLTETMRFEEHKVVSPVFSPAAPPVTAAVRGWRVPGWRERNGSAEPTPQSPVKPEGQAEDLLSSEMGHPIPPRNRNPARNRNHSAGSAQYSAESSGTRLAEVL